MGKLRPESACSLLLLWQVAWAPAPGLAVHRRGPTALPGSARCPGLRTDCPQELSLLRAGSALARQQGTVQLAMQALKPKSFDSELGSTSYVLRKLRQVPKLSEPQFLHSHDPMQMTTGVIGRAVDGLYWDYTN